MARDYARYFSEELYEICPHDCIFAAAYRLHTPGAKQWIKTQYLKESRNFKIISKTFLRQLYEVGNPRVRALRAFIRETFPRNVPPMISYRIRDLSRVKELKSLIDYESFFPHTDPSAIEYSVAEATHTLWNALDFNWQLDSLERTLKNGADPDLEFCGVLPLYTAISKNNKDAVRLLLEYGANPNNQDCAGEIPLLFYSLTNKEICSLLLLAGANPNCRYHSGTALSHALNTDLNIELLLQAGANPNIPGIRTCWNGSMFHIYPLELAISYNRLSDVKLLLAAGARIDIKCSKLGISPTKFATSIGNHEIATIIMQHEENLIKQVEEASSK